MSRKQDGFDTQQKIYTQLEQAYGIAGVYAAEGMCLTQEDYDLGFDHCVKKIAPALEEEEELMVNGRDRLEWADEFEL
jgi:hypothetical protein